MPNSLIYKGLRHGVVFLKYRFHGVKEVFFGVKIVFYGVKI